MENKPKFCSECGAKLTGSAAFCPECGAKQQIIPAPAPAPVAAPVAAPENSLAVPKKLRMSVPALIIAIVALMTTGLAVLFQCVAALENTKFDPNYMTGYIRSRGVLSGMLTCSIVPIVAILVTIIKKKPVALIGLIATGVCILAQFVAALLYSPVVMSRIPMNVFGRLLVKLVNWTNGEGLFYNLQRNIRFGITNPWVYFGASMISMALYWFKNILAILSCLLVVLKKKK